MFTEIFLYYHRRLIIHTIFCACENPCFRHPFLPSFQTTLVVINVISDVHHLMMRYPLMSKARLRKTLMPSFLYDRQKDLKSATPPSFVKYFVPYITYILLCANSKKKHFGFLPSLHIFPLQTNDILFHLTTCY